MSTKVLLINNCHYRRGGADVVYLNTGKLLEKNNHEVIYFSIKDEKNIENNFENYFVNNINFFNTNVFKKFFSFFRFFYSFEAKNKLDKLIKLFKPDVAHIHFYKGGLTSSIIKSLIVNKIPIILTAHDYGIMDPHNALLDGNFNICDKIITKGPFYSVLVKSNRNSYLYSFISYLEYSFHNLKFPFDKVFNTIITVSKFSEKKFKESSFFKFNTKHLYNFFPGIYEKIPNHKKGDYFLFFGRLSKEKGFKTLINVWSNLKIESKLVIAGSYELKSHDSDLNILIKETKSIEMVGFKKGLDLECLIKNASFVLMPSEWYENNPLSIIESYALGKPVIGSDIGGITEIIEHNKTGFLMKMKDEKNFKCYLKKAFEMSDENYLKMSINARNFALKNFNPEKHYQTLCTIYQNTIKDYE